MRGRKCPDRERESAEAPVRERESAEADSRRSDPPPPAGFGSARLVPTFTPAGIDRWFEETLVQAPNDASVEDVPDNLDEVAARYAAEAARYGIEFV
jgi:hypothetical protein